MRHFGISFEEKLIRLDQPNTQTEILKYSAAGKVPILIDNKIKIWDSLAIAEYLNEKFPEKQMWPKDPKARAMARSISAEMHSGFITMRNHMSHHLKKTFKGFDWSPAKADVERIQSIWTECLNESGGPFLFKDFSIADAMYAPVVNRFITYDVKTTGSVAEYIKTIRNLPAHLEWIKGAMAEDFIVPKYENPDSPA